MKLLMKKVLRDIKFNKGRSLSIIFIVALATALYGGLYLSYLNIDRSLKENEERSNLEHVRFIIDETNSSEINLDTISRISAWDTRLSILTGLIVENDDTVYTGALYGVDVSNVPKVNYFNIRAGEFLKPSEGFSPNILVIQQFMEAHDLSINDELFIFTPDGFVDLTITGEIFSPEYLYNVNPISGLPDISGLAAGWVPLPLLQQLYHSENKINEVLVRFESEILGDQELLENKILEIQSKIALASPNVSFVRVEDEPEQVMKNADVGALDDTARVFGLVVLLLALFAIYDIVSKLITTQRNYIGTMRALGGSRFIVTLQYSMIGLILGVIGIFLGLPLGWIIAYALTVEYAHLLGIPEPSTSFQLSAFIESILANFGLIFLISLFSSVSAARIQPREAMASSYISTIYSRKSIFEKWLQKIPSFRSPSVTIPIRNIFRHKRKTLLTVLTYSISIVLIISALGFLDSFNHAIDENYDKYEKYDLQVHFTSSMDPTQIRTIIDQTVGIHYYETFASTIIELRSDSAQVSTPIFGFQENSSLRQFKLNRDGTQSGLVLGINVANQLNVGVGDLLTVVNQELHLTGIEHSLMGESAFLTISKLQQIFNLGNNVTGIIIEMDGSVNVDDMKSLLLSSGLPVGIILSTEEVKQSIETFIQGLIAIIGVMVFIGFITVALFSFNTIVLDVMSRENEFVNIRSLGGSRKQIMQVIGMQGLFISLVGSIITIPISYSITDWIIKELIRDVMVLPTIIKPSSYAIGIISAFIASLTGIVSAIRHVMKIDLADAMRTRISN